MLSDCLILSANITGSGAIPRTYMFLSGNCFWDDDFLVEMPTLEEILC